MFADHPCGEGIIFSYCMDLANRADAYHRSRSFFEIAGFSTNLELELFGKPLGSSVASSLMASNPLDPVPMALGKRRLRLTSPRQTVLVVTMRFP
jgi:hypothetical protein